MKKVEGERKQEKTITKAKLVLPCCFLFFLLHFLLLFLSSSIPPFPSVLSADVRKYRFCCLKYYAEALNFRLSLTLSARKLQHYSGVKTHVNAQPSLPHPAPPPTPSNT